MISLKNVSKAYNSFLAVDHLYLEINKEFFVFLGPNGAGKTSTIKMMTGLITPTSGEISINGIDLLKNPIEAKKQFGLVPDQPALYEKLTAREFVQFVGTVYKVPDTKVEERMNRLFDIFELAERIDDLIEDFSHGMKQKVALVAALIHEPAVLFLDEPTVGLDPHAVRNLKDLLRGLVARGTTVFMSTHILEIAEQMCDRVGIIDKGKLLAVGTLNELRANSSSPGGSLEDIFLELTGTPYQSKVKDFLETF